MVKLSDVNEVTPEYWPNLDCELRDLGQENLRWLLEHWRQYQPESPQANQRHEKAVGVIKSQLQLAETDAPIFASLRSAKHFSHDLPVFGTVRSFVIGNGVVESRDETTIFVRPYGGSVRDTVRFCIHSPDVMLLRDAAYLLTHPDYLKIWRAVSAAPIA